MKTFPPEVSRAFLGFLVTLMAVFGLGLGARQANWFWFLWSYPFRLGALFLPLFFSLGAVHSLRLGLEGTSRGKRGWGVLIVIFLAWELLRQGMPVTPLKRAGETIVQWRNYFSGRSADDFDEMARWIRARTAPASGFIAPPWEYRFWLLAERPQVVSFKLVPVNHGIKEWYHRLLDLNGNQPFRERGSAVLGELKANYPHLSIEKLLGLKDKYGVRYYLTVLPREDLAFLRVHANDSFYLYDLEQTVPR